MDGEKSQVQIFVEEAERGGKTRLRTTFGRVKMVTCFSSQIAEYLNKDKANVQIQVWNILDEELIQQPQAYPAGQFDQFIHLLQTNVIVPHFDLMTNRKQK